MSHDKLPLVNPESMKAMTRYVDTNCKHCVRVMMAAQWGILNLEPEKQDEFAGDLGIIACGMGPDKSNGWAVCRVPDQSNKSQIDIQPNGGV